MKTKIKTFLIIISLMFLLIFTATNINSKALSFSKNIIESKKYNELVITEKEIIKYNTIGDWKAEAIVLTLDLENFNFKKCKSSCPFNKKEKTAKIMLMSRELKLLSKNETVLFATDSYAVQRIGYHISSNVICNSNLKEEKCYSFIRNNEYIKGDKHLLQVNKFTEF